MNTHIRQLASPSRRPAQQQRGVALITVLLVLLILTAIAFGLMYMANTETMINANFRSTQSAFAASQAGLQEARERLMTSNVVPHLIVGPTLLPGNPNSILYIINGAGVNPLAAGSTFDSEFCAENFAGPGGGQLVAPPPAPGQPCTVGPPLGSVGAPIVSDAPFSGTPAALSYKWVRITGKANNTACGPGNFNCNPGLGYPVVNPATTNNTTPICWDGSHQLPKPAGYATCASAPPAGATAYYMPVFVVTSLAMTPSGARRMTQMEVAEMPPIITNAALDTQDFVNTSGSSVTVNGYDNCKCNCTAAPGGGAPTCKDRVTGLSCTGATYAIYTTEQVSSSGSPAIIAGTDPATAQNQTNFPYDIPTLVDMYSNASGAKPITGAPYNQACNPPPAGSPPGTPYDCGGMQGPSFGTPPTNFPTFDPTNPVGEVDQITVVPGSITLSAHTEGAGVLVVQGDLTVTGGINFYGLIIVTGRFVIKGSGTGQSTNILGSVLAGEGTSADVISGGVNLQYDLCALSHNKIKQPPAMLAFRELAY